MSNEAKPAKQSRTRPPKPGFVRVIVSLTQEHFDDLAAQAKAAEPVFTRPVNEWLSIELAKKFAERQTEAKPKA